jgi:hypothetical protein
MTGGGAATSRGPPPTPSPSAPDASATDASATGTDALVPDMPQKSPAPRPSVSDTRLGNLVENLYKAIKSSERVGDGTTMDAIRNEIRTGRPTGGCFHTTKGKETLRGLQNWLRRNPAASGADRSVAENLIRQLDDALGGR